MTSSFRRHALLRLSPVLAIALLLGSGCTQMPAESAPNGPASGEPSGRWETVPVRNAPTARHENAFVKVDDRFYLLGGRGDRPVDIYDPETQTWREGARPPFQLHHFQAVAQDGLIYVIGAFTDDYPTERGISAVQIYDPAADAWRTGPEIPEGRRRGAAGAVAYDGKIYVVGGLVGGHGPHADAVDWFDVFDPATGAWTALEDRPAPRVRDHFSAAVVGDRLYLAGGRNTGVENFSDSTIAAVDVYDFASGRWTTLDEAPLPTERAGTAAIGHGRYVVVTGGEGFGQAWRETEALDTETNRWTLIGNLRQPRHGTQLLEHDGALYIAGGAGDQGGGPELSDMERFVFE